MVKRILLIENIPSLNKGEETILQGMLESFSLFGDFKFSMFTTNPDLDKSRYELIIHLIDIRRHLLFFNDSGYKIEISKYFSSTIFLLNHIVFLILFKLIGLKTLKLYHAPLWREYLSSDIIILGHNGAFAIGGGSSIPVIGYPIFMPFFINKINKFSVLYAGSIANPEKMDILSKIAFKFALNRLNLITLRENISYNHCIDLGIKNENIYVTSDVAFLMKPVTDDRVSEIMVRENLQNCNKPLIGITATRESANKAYPDLSHDHSYDKHIKLLASIIDETILKINASFVFLPHCIGPDLFLDDRLVAKDIFSHITMKNHIILINNEYNAAELKGLIGQLDLLIGERIHSVINAISINVPVIVISNKDDARLEMIRMSGQNEAIYTIEDLQPQIIINKIYDIFANTQDIREKMVGQSADNLNRSMQNGILLYQLAKP